MGKLYVVCENGWLKTDPMPHSGASESLRASRAEGLPAVEVLLMERLDIEAKKGLNSSSWLTLGVLALRMLSWPLVLNAEALRDGDRASDLLL